jgi:hypothetical protein
MKVRGGAAAQYMSRPAPMTYLVVQWLANVANEMGFVGARFQGAASRDGGKSIPY